MQDILLKNGDIVFDSSDLRVVSEEDELAQSVQNLLGIQAGEFIIEKGVGLDRGNMIGKDYHADYLKQDIAYAIKEQEPRITFIENITTFIENRKLFIELSMVGKKNERVVMNINVE